MRDVEYGQANDSVLPRQVVAESVVRSSLRSLLLRGGAVLGFALLTALGAQVAIPLPGTPVPLTLQTLFVLLAGATLGPRLGVVSMLTYLALGLAGYHVFAFGCLGWATLVGPTGGYLLGFILAQPVMGRFANGPRLSWARTLAALLAGQVVIYGVGLTWLAACLRTDLNTTLFLGLCPFLPGLAIKTAIAAVATPHLSRVRRVLESAGM